MTAPRYDVDAEQALIGDLIAFPHRIGDVADHVLEVDFYRPACRLTYAAIIELWRTGSPIDTVTVVRQLRETGTLEEVGGPTAVSELASKGTGGWRRYAQAVTAEAVARRLMSAAQAIADLANDPTVDPGEALDAANALLQNIDAPLGQPPRDLWELDAFLDRPVEQRQPWVVPGLIRRGWRTMVVAPEGFGKSQLMRAFAICCAQGVHPLRFTPIPRVRTLIVDLENPDDAITDTCSVIRRQARRSGVYESGRAWLWHRPDGVDLRRRSERAELEAVLVATQPDLVCLGPLYKAWRAEAKEGFEYPASEVQRVLDDFRTRYNFALLLEHHAPKSQGGQREFSPFGSSVWLRWPDQGIKLQPDPDFKPRGHRLLVQRFRGDRLPANWPDALERGKEWPWVGVWTTNPADADWTEPEEGLW